MIKNPSRAGGRLARHALLACLLLVALNAAAQTPAASDAAAARTEVKESTAEHGKFSQLKKPFKTGEEVTEACLSCHTEAAKQVMAHAALDLGLRQPIHRPAPGQEDHAQQLLHRRSFQRGVLPCLPCGLRLEGRPVRFQLGKERRLPGLPQHRPVRQDPRPGRPSRLPAHGISAGFRQVRRGGGPAEGRPAGRQDQSRHLRRVPFLRRRRRRGEARRSGFLAEAARPQAGRAHGRGWRQLHLRHLPQDREPPHRRKSDSADRLRSAPCHPARRENRPQSGKLPGLPRQPAAQAGAGRGPAGQPDAGRPPQRPYPHAGLPDLPHSCFRPRRRAHQDVLGLVHGGHAGRRRQAVPEER